MRRFSGMVVFAVLLAPTAAPAQVISGSGWAQAGVVTSGSPMLVITGQGVVSRAPDMATINASIMTNDDAAEKATGKNNAAYDALKTSLARLGVAETQIKTSYYNVTFNPQRPQLPAPLAPGSIAVDPKNGAYPYPYPYPGQRYGFIVNRQLSVTVSKIANVGPAIDALVSSGVTNVSGVQYGLADHKAAFKAALTAAMEDAASQAETVAAASNLKLAGIKQISVGPNYFGGPVPMMPPMRGAGIREPAPPSDLPPSSVEIRASVTVTYALKS